MSEGASPAAYTAAVSLPSTAHPAAFVAMMSGALPDANEQESRAERRRATSRLRMLAPSGVPLGIYHNTYTSNSKLHSV